MALYVVDMEVGPLYGPVRGGYGGRPPVRGGYGRPLYVEDMEVGDPMGSVWTFYGPLWTLY